MINGNSLINVGELSKPATVLIGKISDAIGGYVRPHQIKRVAKAEAEAKIIKKKADLEITALEKRAVNRFISEEAKKQKNIEKITAKAIENLEKESNPEEVEDDWIANFFNKCRLISDEEMQKLWAKVLAGEANSANTYSKRTVNFLSSMDKIDAEIFQTLCGFCWNIGEITPLIFEVSDNIYTENGLTFNSLEHLDDIGLISFNSSSGSFPSGYFQHHLPNKVRIFYYGTPIVLDVSYNEGNALPLGDVSLSKTGEELAPICDSKPVENFLEFVLNKWLVVLPFNSLSIVFRRSN
jgi:hypothetical protein